MKRNQFLIDSIIEICSHVYPDKESLMENALSMATQIAENSPVAVAGTKEQLNYARDHSLEDGLNYVVSLCYVSI